MTPLRLFPVVFLLAVAISGCSMMQPHGDELATKLDQLVAEKRYGDALDLLNGVSPGAPDYARFAERRKQTETLAAQYERKVVEDARQLVAQERWGQALNLYDEALGRLPRSNRLRDGLAELRRQQQTRVTEQERELVISKGEWLLAVLPAYRRLATIDPRSSDRERQVTRHQSDAEETAAALLNLGNTAADAGDDEFAGRAITLAARLSDKPEIRQAAQKYEQGRDKRTRDGRLQNDKRARDQAARQQERSETIQQLMKEYDAALQQHDYLAARTLLAKLRPLAPELVSERGYEGDLKQRIEDETERLNAEGATYYGHGEFEKARDSWTKALQLTPSHTKAKENLKRVEKVLARIEHLRKKQKPQ